MMGPAAGRAFCVAICLLIWSLMPVVAQAQTAADSAFAQCGAIANSNARLACYDTARDQSKSMHWPELSAPPAPTMAPPAMAVHAPLPPAPRPGKLVAAVRQYSLSPHGRFTVVLDNGEIWRQLDSDDGAAQFRRNGRNIVEISRGFWGSYDLRLNAANLVYKVSRIK